MGRPDQGNKAQTPVGYSHDTGVSTGGPVTAATGVVARDTPRVHGFAWGRATALLALRRMSYDTPWARCTGLGEQPEGPVSGEARIEDSDGVMVGWTVWWAYLGWRGDLGGTVLRGTRGCRCRCTGVTGVCMVVLGSVWWEYRGCAAVLGSRTVGALRSRMAVLGCPPDPSNNSGGMQGHPLAP